MRGCVAGLARTIPYLPIALMFPVVGLFVGWLVGQSREPAVNAFLPLLVGLAGGIVAGILQGKRKTQEILSIIESCTDSGTKDKITEAFKEYPAVSTQFAGWWACGVLIFTLACYWGISRGVQARISTYQPLKSVLQKISGTSQLTADELASLYLAWWSFDSMNVPENQVVAMFSDVLPKVLSEKPSERGFATLLNSSPNRIESMFPMILYKGNAIQFEKGVADLYLDKDLTTPHASPPEQLNF